MRKRIKWLKSVEISLMFRCGGKSTMCQLFGLLLRAVEVVTYEHE